MAADDGLRLAMIGRLLRSRWRLLLLLAALGAGAGLGTALLWPPTYQSSSRVLLQGDPEQARVLSEAQIAMSLAVLDRTAAALHWAGIDGPALRNSVTAAVADGNVIEIKAGAKNPDQARQLAEQVTQHYIAFSTEIEVKTANASGEVLTPRRDSLQQQIADIDRRIGALQGSAGLLNANDARGAAARAELQQLSSDQASAVQELTDLDGRIAQAQAQAAAVSQERFSVIEQPVTPTSAQPPTRLQLVIGGAALAAALGSVVLVAIRLADRRLRHESDIGAALGAPVLGTVSAPAELVVPAPAPGSHNGYDTGAPPPTRGRLLANSIRWSATLSHDQSLEHLRYRRVLAQLRAAPDELLRLLIIVTDHDLHACRAAGQLAIAATDDGRPVCIRASSRQLAGTVDAFLSTSHPQVTPINVAVGTSAGHLPEQPCSVLSIVSVAAARPTIPDSGEASAVLVAVTSGTRTARELFAITQACYDAGHLIAGVLVVLPEIEAADHPRSVPSQPGMVQLRPPPGGAGWGAT